MRLIIRDDVTDWVTKAWEPSNNIDWLSKKNDYTVPDFINLKRTLNQFISYIKLQEFR